MSNFRGIAAELNRRGHKKRRGTQWRLESVVFASLRIWCDVTERSRHAVAFAIIASALLRPGS